MKKQATINKAINVTVLQQFVKENFLWKPTEKFEKNVSIIN